MKSMDDNSTAVRDFWNSRAVLGKHAGTRDLIAKKLEMDAIISFVRDGMKILDVGCGNGLTAIEITRQFNVVIQGIDFADDMIAWGAGPRAVQFLILGGKARALLHGRTHVSTDDIQALAKPVLRHRMVVNFAAESEGVAPDDLVERLVSITPTKEDELTSDARFQKIFAS